MGCQQRTYGPNKDAYLERRIFAEVAVREDEQEFAPARRLRGSLQGVRDARRKIPQIARALHVARGVYLVAQKIRQSLEHTTVAK